MKPNLHAHVPQQMRERSPDGYAEEDDDGQGVADDAGRRYGGQDDAFSQQDGSVGRPVCAWVPIKNRDPHGGRK